jgi:cyclase
VKAANLHRQAVTEGLRETAKLYARGEEDFQMKRIIVVALAGGALSFAGAAYAQQTDFSKVEIKVHDLGHHVYMLEGQGGNISVAVGTDGIIMVDTQFAPLHDKIKAAIEKISPLPIKYVINTHFHVDHVGGNEAFSKDGAIVVAHENVKAHMAAGSRNNVSGDLVPPAPPAALPQQTYKDTLTLRVGGLTAELKHPVDVHTDGDTYVNFPDRNVLIAGDLAFFNRYPNIDYLYSGSIDGQIRGAEELLALVKEDTTIVPGHGPVGTTATLRDYRQMLITARDRIAKLKTAGKTEDEIIAMKPNADYDAKFGVDQRAIGNFIRVVFRSLKN